MKGIAYGVGVGPGDPELMTLKACRLIRENEVIAVPGTDPKETVAYKIAVAAVPELADRQLIAIDMPMVKDRKRIDESHRRGAQQIEQYLSAGKNVVYLTLGDPTVYCTFSYVQHYLEADGYQVVLVSGITSFCAAAARAGQPLVEWNEALHVLPGVHLRKAASEPAPAVNPLAAEKGTCVLMKSASHMKDVKDLLRESGRDVFCVEKCTMENEKVYRSLDEIPDDAGYFSLIIAKEKK